MVAPFFKIFKMLQARWDMGARICVRLDSDRARLPTCVSGDQLAFNKAIVDATHRFALAYKPNIAFYVTNKEREALQATIEYIRDVAPDVPVILDFKRGDIGNTNNGYVREIRLFKAHGATINPYFSMQAAYPFLLLNDVGIFVVCRTSDPIADTLQDMQVLPHPEDALRWGIPEGETIPLYQRVAYEVAREWHTVSANCALVVGATTPKPLAAVRRIIGDDMWMLAPGIGAQGGNLHETLQHGCNARGSGLVVSSSRGIIFASDKEDFAEAAGRETSRLTAESNAILASLAPYP